MHSKLKVALVLKKGDFMRRGNKLGSGKQHGPHIRYCNIIEQRGENDPEAKKIYEENKNNPLFLIQIQTILKLRSDPILKIKAHKAS
jgi:hypothetical protein